MPSKTRLTSLSLASKRAKASDLGFPAQVLAEYWPLQWGTIATPFSSLNAQEMTVDTYVIRRLPRIWGMGLNWPSHGHDSLIQLKERKCSNPP